MVSAILLCAIAFSLFMAVVSLSKIQYEEEITLLTLPFWGVYFPIGLHGGWTLAGGCKCVKRGALCGSCFGESARLFRCVEIRYKSLPYFPRRRSPKSVHRGSNGSAPRHWQDRPTRANRFSTPPLSPPPSPQPHEPSPCPLHPSASSFWPCPLRALLARTSHSKKTRNETTASLVNINVALELTDAGSELSAFILSVVGAAVAAAFASLVFHNQVRGVMLLTAQVYLCCRGCFCAARCVENGVAGVSRLSLLWYLSCSKLDDSSFRSRNNVPFPPAPMTNRIAPPLCIQPYLLAIAWAIAGIAAEQGYRRRKLGRDIADGIDEALQGLWIALLCVGVLGIIAGMRQRDGSDKAHRRPTPSAPRSEDHDLTSAIYSS